MSVIVGSDNKPGCEVVKNNVEEDRVVKRNWHCCFLLFEGPREQVPEVVALEGQQSSIGSKEGFSFNVERDIWIFLVFICASFQELSEEMIIEAYDRVKRF